MNLILSIIIVSPFLDERCFNWGPFSLVVVYNLLFLGPALCSGPPNTYLAVFRQQFFIV